MAYFHENTIKEQLISNIQDIANKLNTHVQFDHIDNLTYEYLTAFKDELLSEYNQKQFNKGKPA